MKEKYWTTLTPDPPQSVQAEQAYVETESKLYRHLHDRMMMPAYEERGQRWTSAATRLRRTNRASISISVRVHLFYRKQIKFLKSS
jgi:hypothetical protein